MRYHYWYCFLSVNVKHPVTNVVKYIQQHWIAGFVSLGTIGSIMTVLLVMIYGQRRICFCYAMRQDRLLPKVISSINLKIQSLLLMCLRNYM